MDTKVESAADKKRKFALQKRYGQRITIARQGREYFSQKDYVNAAKKYNEYLGILAELNEVDDIYKLSPPMFDQKAQVTEMLLISHIYWELARIHEMTPKLQVAYNKCVTQFIKFTANQPYQVLNAEMLRKYIKKNKRVTPQVGVLNQAYQQIFVQSKKCYVSTLCFGQDGFETLILRDFKTLLLKMPMGQSMVSIYYRLSSKLVSQCEQNDSLERATVFIAKPILHSFAKLLKRSIFK
jgi:hypothetical protein